jgi:hypothetical protein
MKFTKSETKAPEKKFENFVPETPPAETKVVEAKWSGRFDHPVVRGVTAE